MCRARPRSSEPTRFILLVPHTGRFAGEHGPRVKGSHATHGFLPCPAPPLTPGPAPGLLSLSTDKPSPADGLPVPRPGWAKWAHSPGSPGPSPAGARELPWVPPTQVLKGKGAPPEPNNFAGRGAEVRWGWGGGMQSSCPGGPGAPSERPKALGYIRGESGSSAHAPSLALHIQSVLGKCPFQGLLDRGPASDGAVTWKAVG